MLPLSLLKSAIDLPILIELKNGDTYNGKLANIDLWMNISMKQVVRTSRDGDEFWSLPEVYVRGNTIKYVRIPDSVLDAVAEEKQAREASRNRMRGGGRSRGRGRGGGGGGDRDGGGKGGSSRGRGYGKGGQKRQY